MALTGPTGGGKTYTALSFATEIAKITGGRVAVLDTENRRSDLMTGVFDFDAMYLTTDFSVEKYVAAIKEACTAKDESGLRAYNVMVVDSLTHAWVGPGGVLDKVNNSGGSNKFTDGWGKVGTPAQQKLINAIVASPIHIIVTMRSDMDYEIETKDGKKIPRKIGLKPVQRKDVEYDFDVVCEISIEHVLTVTKTPPIEGYDGMQVANPTGDTIRPLVEWLMNGEAALENGKAPKFANWGDLMLEARKAGKIADANGLKEAGKSLEDATVELFGV